MKSGFSATASDDQLSGWTEKKASEHFPKPNLHQKGHSHCLVVCCPSDKDTRVGSQSLLQGIFLIQGSNLCLLHCRQILSHLLCVCGFQKGDNSWQFQYFHTRATLTLTCLTSSFSTLLQAPLPLFSDLAGTLFPSCQLNWISLGHFKPLMSLHTFRFYLLLSEIAPPFCFIEHTISLF